MVELALISIAVIILIGYGYYIYDQNIRLFLPSEFGIENFQRIAKWESIAWRERVYKEGITRSEWQKVNIRQLNAITDELKRRGGEPE